MEAYIVFHNRLYRSEKETTVFKMTCFISLPTLRLQNNGSHIATAYRVAILSLSSPPSRSHNNCNMLFRSASPYIM